eukprot:scaffold26231_cov29-Tisochrysis_lutea.AAC.5
MLGHDGMSFRRFCRIRTVMTLGPGDRLALALAADPRAFVRPLAACRLSLIVIVDDFDFNNIAAV